MADFDAPSGPPPPKRRVCASSLKLIHRNRFYVNTVTKKSQWDKPTAPATAGGDEPDGPPPSYSAGSGPAPSDSKKNPFLSHDSDGDRKDRRSPVGQEAEDERLARQLQQEENQRAVAGGGSPNLSTAGPGGSVSGGDGPSGQRGLLGKLFNKNKTSSSNYGGNNNGGGGYPGEGYGPTGYANTPPPPQQGYGGGYGGYGGGPGYGAPQGGYYGGGPPQGYYGGPPQGYYGGPPQGYYGGGGYPQQQRPQRQGLGTAGAAALGVGGGLLGGMLLGEAIDGGDGGDGGGDDGGGDDGGGDF
ncbi:hypothetical protein SPBR_01899 [Sporothrix brasiliensis 5110]|uniref:WW domain-containing protein n=1 Tax=Sporothrix brasiliensis 5110 TaxID=1398154 RepID=A0A0C2FKE7_9PEZI|nr:uncharacterized protein SPBR_01899 [Sporothrix brasiliensis 5110]KIH91543.1 hypothetical protein SPBR_01899 [Sporothrix brasiliensis 5110]